MKIKVTLEEFGGMYCGIPRKLISNMVAQTVAISTRAFVHGVLGEIDVEVYWCDKLITSISMDEFNNW